MNKLKTVLFADASIFINSITEPNKGKITSALRMMEDDIEIVRIKTLRTPIKELIVKKYRLLFFMKGNIAYFTNGFIKKTQKTPRYEIEYSEKVYKLMYKSL